MTLKVTVAEVSRSVMKQLGVNMSGGGVSNGISYGGISESIAGAIGNNLSDTGFGLATSNFSAYLRAMESAGVMKTLAEPTLTAISGEKQLSMSAANIMSSTASPMTMTENAPINWPKSITVSVSNSCRPCWGRDASA